LLRYKRPEHIAAATLPTKLIGLKVGAIDMPIVPPMIMDAVPIQGPSISPINGAMTVAIVMNFPAAPMTGKNDANERTAYKEAKMHINAKSFVPNCKPEASSLGNVLE